MKSDAKVAAAPSKPVMIFDGDCHFCGLWIKRWHQETGDRVEYIRFQDVQTAERFPELTRERLATSVHLVECDGSVFTGAEAVFKGLACNPEKRRWLHLYRDYDWLADLSESSYRFVAGHRTLFSWLTRIGWGQHTERPDYFLVRWAFLRAMGIIYLIAFISLWVQIVGLVGHDGIYPAQRTMAGVEEQAARQGLGVERFWLAPTFCWFSASDRSLNLQCVAGTVLAALLIIGIAPAPCLFLLWLIYLSLANICPEFLSFQWDYLLLETGFLAIFFAPLTLLPGLSRESPPSRIVLWLLRWLLFRLMFESGCVKLLSGDTLWHNLTALTVHYETQPLPTWIGWWAHQMPVWFQKASCVGMFATELIVPFLIFAPRRPRFVGCIAMVVLQVVILLTGNYTFFNWLAIALCLLLLDDFVLRRILYTGRRPESRTLAETGTKEKLEASSPPPSPPSGEERAKNLRLHGSENRLAKPRCRAWPRFVTVPLAVVVLLISLFQLAVMFGVRSPILIPGAQAYQWLSPMRSFNNYGLFAVMTNPRMEIIVEGSDDGQTWLPYEFKYKPGDVMRRPGFVAPHQPRVDWQMWFAALGDYRQNDWFVIFCVRLLQNSPPVLALLEKNPFPAKPPQYIRAQIYEYHFTTPEERRKTGAWWRRELKGDYLPVISLKDLEH